VETAERVLYLCLTVLVRRGGQVINHCGNLSWLQFVPVCLLMCALMCDGCALGLVDSGRGCVSLLVHLYGCSVGTVGPAYVNLLRKAGCVSKPEVPVRLRAAESFREEKVSRPWSHLQLRNVGYTSTGMYYVCAEPARVTRQAIDPIGSSQQAIRESGV
jgi:hypothetical protein